MLAEIFGRGAAAEGEELGSNVLSQIFATFRAGSPYRKPKIAD